MYQLHNANFSVCNKINKNVEETIKQLCVSIKSSKNNWENFENLEVINLLMITIEIMEHIQDKIIASVRDYCS